MKEKWFFYRGNGRLESDIIVDKNGYLVDGYTSYLIAKEYGKKIVKVKRVWKTVKYLEKGCVLDVFGLAEEDWCGSEQCETYKKYKNKSGLDICKEILGVQERIRLW